MADLARGEVDWSLENMEPPKEEDEDECETEVGGVKEGRVGRLSDGNTDSGRDGHSHAEVTEWSPSLQSLPSPTLVASKR